MVRVGAVGTGRVDQQVLAEYRYRAVREVLGGSPVGEVAERYGSTRQSLHSGMADSEARSPHELFFRLSASMRSCSASECRSSADRIAAKLARELARPER